MLLCERTESITMYVPNSWASSGSKSGITSRITFGISPLLIVSAGTFCPIACCTSGFCNILAFKSTKSFSIISFTRVDLIGRYPSIYIVWPFPSSSIVFLSPLLSHDCLGLKLYLGAITSSIRSEAEIALRILFTLSTISSLFALGSATKFVNWACVLFLLSLVHLPIIWTISVKEPLYPIVNVVSQYGQSNPSFAIPNAIIISISSGFFILRKYDITFSLCS